MSTVPVRRALLSVSDKTGLTELARGLTARGVELYSTGGTRRHLEEADIAVQDIAEYTGFPEMMDGRVKTLHPKVFAGILCRHDRSDDMEALEEHSILSFELVVVNLYPFEQTIARPDVTRSEAIEQIDIGGPSLVRAAAKNHAFTAILTSPDQYSAVLAEVEQEGGTSLALREQLAAAAFSSTAAYDRAIAAYFNEEGGEAKFPDQMTLQLERQAELRYGENPHQAAAVYQVRGATGASLMTAQQLNGKELSYNNLLDLDSALQIARSFDQPAVSVIKHNNPCGAAVAESISDATAKAMAGDPLSAFGSVLGLNREVDDATAELLSEPGLFVEAIVAPGFSTSAIEILTTKPKWKKNVRLMEVGDLGELSAELQLRYLGGQGLLVQESDSAPDQPDQWEVVTEVKPDDAMLAELHGFP